MPKGIVVLIIVILCAYTNAQKMNFYGFIQNNYIFSEETEPVPGHPGIEDATSGFRLRRAVFGYRQDIDEVYSLTGHLEYAYKDQILLDAYATAKFSSYCNIRIGQFIPLTQTAEAGIVPTDYLFYTTADLTQQTGTYSGFTVNRDIGIAMYGAVDKLQYYVFAGNGLGTFAIAGDQKFSNVATIRNRKPLQGYYGIRLDYSLIPNVKIGGHIGINKQDSIRISDDVSGTEKIYNLDRIVYSLNLDAGEILVPGLFARFEMGGGEIKDKDADPIARITAPKGSGIEYNGMHATIGYRFLAALIGLVRYERFREEYFPGGYNQFDKFLIGMQYLVLKEKNEVARIALNYAIKKEQPTERHNNILVLLLQLRY